jgi:hypothetical protein
MVLAEVKVANNIREQWQAREGEEGILSNLKNTPNRCQERHFDANKSRVDMDIEVSSNKAESLEVQVSKHHVGVNVQVSDCPS